MKKLNPTIIGVVVIGIILVGGTLLAFAASRTAATAQYARGDTNRPHLEIGQTDFGFGTLSLSEIKTQDITIQNTGKGTLILSDFITSCDCTFAQVIINGQSSPKFSMHRNPNWRGEILPNRTATIKIIYEPKIMPVKGAVQRQVVFRTNDPEKPLVNIRFTARVQ